ncbi:alpha/beta fold hydrolase [Variovorax sp. YR752]|uniref:alpha/beta hydrolase n=1 Tax=Variovorax sp. YR752 TaxID=1884383 RepID=UPI0031380F85
MAGSPSPAANPAAAFYAASSSARALGAALRWTDRLAPAWATRGALRLFFTPLPWKLAARRPLPAPWQVTHWAFEGVRLAAHRRRDIAPGRPLVLLVHGWAGSAGQMRRLADTLAEQGFDPVLLDLPAHGASGGWRATLPQFARAIFAATARLGPLHGMVAHSLGALAALHTAARGLPVRRLALIAPSAPPAQFIAWFAGSFGLPARIGERMRSQIERREGVPLDQYEPAWLGPRIAAPTLLLHDEGDRVAPFAASQRLAQATPALRLAPLTGLGHRRILDDAGVADAVAAHLLAADSA